MSEEADVHPIEAAYNIISGKHTEGDSFQFRGVVLHSIEGTNWAVHIGDDLVDIVDVDAEFNAAREFLEYIDAIQQVDHPHAGIEATVEEPPGRGVQ